MKAPVLTSGGGIYQLRWLDQHISIRLDRLAEDSKYNVTAEILITTTDPSSPPHLHQARFNLTSTTARRTIAQHLSERMNHLDWHAIIEQASVLTLEQYRAGTPVINLAEHQIKESLAFRLAPMLQERQASLLFGPGDSGKSFLAMYFGTMIAAAFPHGNFMPEPGNVLYLDYETDADTAAQRLRMISAGLNCDVPKGFHYRYCHQTLAAEIETIQRHVLQRDISLLIIDSAAPAVGEPESSTMTNQYFSALRSLEITSLTIAHVAKTGKVDEPFGSIFFRNLPRANFRVTASHEPGDPSFAVSLKHTKSNNGIRIKDLGLRFAFEPDKVTLTQIDHASVRTLAESLGVWQLIQAVLKTHGKLTIAEMAELTRKPLDQISARVGDHKAYLVKVGQEYGLKDQGLEY